MANTSQVRIIAGCWRGRKMSFPTNLSIRPTPDRVRETLFNWLAPYILDSSCLDLFAGSGVLGFEALSRGASEIVFVDSENTIINNLKEQHQIFKIDTELANARVDYVSGDAFNYLSTVKKKFDLVFLDPPYKQNKIQMCVELLIENKLMNENGLVYIEVAKNETLPVLPDNWAVLKNKVMSQVACYLIKIT